MMLAKPDRGARGMRVWLARVILIVASLCLVTGIWVDHFGSRAPDPWRERLLNREPLELRFLCGVNLALNCKTTMRLTYQKQKSSWCAKLQPDDPRISEQQLCDIDADRERGTIKLLGVVYSFDKYGFLRTDDHLVGQLRPG